MIELIPLKEVVYEPKARNGTWCKLPYPNHTGKNKEPLGCKNFPWCPQEHLDFKELQAKGYNQWFAVMVEFNRAEFAKKMKTKFPNWTEQQCKNLRLWQNGVRAQLKKKEQSYVNDFDKDILLEIPEACGIKVIVTMIKAGVPMEIKNIQTVRKAMFIGKKVKVK